jgi:three-Cys-motif partner protein
MSVISFNGFIAMAEQAAFAGPHTVQKLDAIENYLRAYRHVMKNTSFTTIFFDAFAGTGDLPIGQGDGALLDAVIDKDEILEGSARRALKINPPFHRYILVEKMRGKAEELLGLKAEFSPISDRVEIIHGDANDELVRFCGDTDWRKSRAVVFLDPFGNQVRWETLEAVARCPIDLWYLFPSHLGVNRQISNSGFVEAAKAQSLDRVFGTAKWRERFLAPEKKTDLFGETESSRKLTNADIVTRFMIERMKTLFAGGVLDEWLPLGKNGAHWFSLLFAWGNESPRAGKIASRIAKQLMTRR